MNTKMKTIGLFAIALVVLTASVGSAQALQPDLTVSSISVNPGDTRADELVRFYVNDNNEISADVCNIGDMAAGPFDVCFAADGTNIGCVEITSLDIGACTTVSIEWTPTCADYPVIPGFPTQADDIAMTVTADCNCDKCPTCPDDGSNGKITESYEANNALSMYIPAIQPWVRSSTKTHDVIAGVVNNGYRSKNFDCNPAEEPLTLFEYDEICGCGGIAYNVSGDKTTIGREDTTRVHHIDIPDGATVKKARLYVYWYDGWGNFEFYPTGCIADLSVDFEDTIVPSDAEYIDQKGFGAWQSPKGTYAYDVTSLVTGSGDYIVKVHNNVYPKTTLLGEMLYVVYDFEGAPCGKTIQLWTLEGNDYLMASHGTYLYSVSVEEATATVAFPGSIDPSNVDSATLVTVVAQGMTPGSNMLFNGNVIKANAWDAGSEAGPKSVPSTKYYGSRINVESVDVKPYLAASGNSMGFEDTAGMQASNAFLIVELTTTIPADVAITPQTMNLKSTDEWTTVHIVPPEGYDVEDIEEDTVYLDCKIFRDAALGDGIFKFSRDEVNAYLDTIVTGSNEHVELTVTGQLSDGKTFEGCDMVRVIKPGH